MNSDSIQMDLLGARGLAQRLAFGPMAFQAIRILWKSGALKVIDDAGESGVSASCLSHAIGIGRYGVDVLLEVAASAGVVEEREDAFVLTKLGSIVLYDKLTQVNFDFVHDVCYQGMFHLEEAIREERPAGLRVFSTAATIYEGLPELPSHVQQSWYGFDHFYSDRAFREAAAIVFRQPVESLLDVGGNTGRWALRCLEKDPAVAVTIADLPGQLVKALELLRATPHAQRVRYYETDLLAPGASLPGGFSVVWMSQFLDCFSEAQIGSILAAARAALAPHGRLIIMETFVDRQRYEAARYSLNAISLYFAVMANGNSRMYRYTTFERLLAEQRYRVIGVHDDLGLGHTLLECCPD